MPTLGYRSYEFTENLAGCFLQRSVHAVRLTLAHALGAVSEGLWLTCVNRDLCSSGVANLPLRVGTRLKTRTGFQRNGWSGTRAGRALPCSSPIVRESPCSARWRSRRRSCTMPAMDKALQHFVLAIGPADGWSAQMRARADRIAFRLGESRCRMSSQRLWRPSSSTVRSPSWLDTLIIHWALACRRRSMMLEVIAAS